MTTILTMEELDALRSGVLGRIWDETLSKADLRERASLKGVHPHDELEAIRRNLNLRVSGWSGGRLACKFGQLDGNEEGLLEPSVQIDGTFDAVEEERLTANSLTAELIEEGRVWNATEVRLFGVGCGVLGEASSGIGRILGDFHGFKGWWGMVTIDRDAERKPEIAIWLRRGAKEVGRARLFNISWCSDDCVRGVLDLSKKVDTLIAGYAMVDRIREALYARRQGSDFELFDGTYLRPISSNFLKVDLWLLRHKSLGVPEKVLPKGGDEYGCTVSVFYGAEGCQLSVGAVVVHKTWQEWSKVVKIPELFEELTSFHAQMSQLALLC